MSFIDKEYWYIFWVVLVGFIGAVLGLLDENGRPRKNRTKKAFLPQPQRLRFYAGRRMR